MEMYRSKYDAKQSRHRFVINWLNSLPNDSLVLDAGAGIQRYKSCASHLRYISQDFGKFSDEKWDSIDCYIISDIKNIPLDECSVDEMF